MLNCIVSLTAILLFAFSLHTIFDLKASITPLVSLAVLVNIASIFAMFDLLLPGVYISYAVAILAIVLAVSQNKSNIKDKISSFFTPGVILFIISCVAMMLFMYARQPLFYEWDEFSFWGISKKLVHIHDQLYTYYTSSMIGNSTPPTLAVLSYYFGWATKFTEWICFFSYDVMFFACYCAFTAAFEKSQWHNSFIVYLFGFLLPYIFEVYTKIIFLEPVYISTYADIPLGIMFAGSLAVYFFGERNDSRNIIPLLPVIIFYTLIKDMGFALSCIVIFIAFFDMCIGRKNFTFFKLKGFFAKCGVAAVMLITAGASFFGWSFHMAKVMARNPFELGGETNMSMVGMLIAGVKELLIGPQSEKFSTIKGHMINALTGTKISFLGTGVVVIGIITVLFVIAFVLGDKNGKKRTAMLYITTWIGFVGYYVFHLFLYVYIFKDNGYDLVSYNRYIYPYYMGWMASGIFALCLACRDGHKLLSRTALFGFVGALLLCFNYLVSYDNIFVEYNERSYAVRHIVMEKADYIKPEVKEDDVIYLFCGGDNGERWFMYTHEFAENYIMEERSVDTQGLDQQQIKEKYQQAFFERFKQYGVTHVMIDNVTETFCHLFGDLFVDYDIGTIGADSMVYFQVKYTDAGFTCEYVGGGELPDA